MSLSSIRSRVEAATPGPWTNGGGTPYMAQVVVKRVHRDEQNRRVTTFLAEVYDCRTPDAGVDPVANSAFIAHARQDIPALLRVAAAAADWLHEEDSFSPYDDSDAHAAVRAIEVAKEALRAALAELEALP